MNVTRMPAADTLPRDFGRAARHVFAVVSQKISSAVGRVATSGREANVDYPRFPWF